VKVRRLVIAPRAELRLREAAVWLANRPLGDETLVVGATSDAASEQIRAVAKTRGAAFGFHRFTLNRLAFELAKLALVTQNLASIGSLAIEALCARVIDRLRAEGKLARLGAVADQPGLPRALARTLDELRMAGVTQLDGELGAALHAIADELATKQLADRARVFEIAAAVAESSEPHLLLGHHVVLLDVRVKTAREKRLVAALVARAPDVLATVPAGDERTQRALEDVFGAAAESLAIATDDALHRVQRHLFSPATYASEPPGEQVPSGRKAQLDPSVHVMSAPGENRECVEIARSVLAEADAGTPYDRMAVLLRSPEQYRVHLEEALHRARIPIHFDRGTRKPDPSGRAILALLACAGEGLSARRFSEYVSLGETPRTVNGAPPPAQRADDRWVPPDEELLPLALVPPQEGSGVPELESLRTPTRWEKLLVDAAVIGGRDRWARRLAGLEARIRLDDRESYRDTNERNLGDLAQLTAFALPLLDDLASLPESASWGVWIERLTALATRALRAPERVLSVLAALNPMRDVGPVHLHEVQNVLHVRLTDLITPPSSRRYGKLFVAAIDAARGLAFDVVFVPGLAERMFPQKLVEDPLLLDATRTDLGLDLETRDDRLRDERLALRLAIGAANRRVVLSYPRIDLDQGRPRVPSFYGLEVLQAAEGALPGFDELGRRADQTGAARIGWPAPDDPQLAIDEAEFDLGVLDEFVGNTHAPKGPARYLLTTGNEHLARALRTRARRWNVKSWKAADGLVLESPETKALLADHQPSVRSFSPTTLQHLAICPYRFALKTIIGLEPREEPEPIEQLGPLERGSLIHEVQFRLLGELRAAGELPLRATALDGARDRLDTVLDTVATEYKDTLYPAIERVWVDGIDAIRADLREWLRRMADDVDWTPRRFELAFGLDLKEGRDPASVDEPVTLDIGIKVRGSIDLVEEGPGGTIRATDYKTGKVAVERGSTIDGGKSLQPALYALALERIFPQAAVAGARLYYCTTRGDFTEVTVTLDDNAREAAGVLAKTLALCLEQGFFPAAPAKDACKYCDYKRVCGPYEEMRLKKKDTKRLSQLHELRSRS
jgi:ATP-dependent helicase/nuclease subunit B